MSISYLSNRLFTPTGPCQDVYRSCKRWREEDRCSWTRPISPFFTDNCAQSCGFCYSNGKKLPLTLPPILDNISWFVGRWECRTMAGERTSAVTEDGQDVHLEVGFMTSKPFKEDTGFIEFDKPLEGEDKVAIESVGNNGLIIIEEGVVKDGIIKLETKFKKSVLNNDRIFKSAKRVFVLIKPDVMEERVIITDSHGITKKWLKRFKRTFNYLTEFVRDENLHE
ncbi:shTK domain protein [Dictyocaulus viviparus]|uniref:ShTK domain protein n=1 Tax=Dictyocaulus viviparus TaxID=29172 RepID=A0A0D8YC45_DICVI|nr:shTK domain protein [Dictyocaulus viviparus]